MRDGLNTTLWRRIVAGGALWTVIYNFAWGVAWFAFMRGEWESTMAALGRPIPWTAEIWFVWVVLTFPIGVAIMAYAGRAAGVLRRALAATAAVWLLITIGNGVAFLQMSVSIRVIALDSFVNLAGMILAACAGGWSVGDGAG